MRGAYVDDIPFSFMGNLKFLSDCEERQGKLQEARDYVVELLRLDKTCFPGSVFKDLKKLCSLERRLGHGTQAELIKKTAIKLSPKEAASF